MENNYCYRLTIKMPETGIVIENDIILNKEVSIYSIPQIAVDKGIITKEDVNNITSVTRVDEKESKALFYQAEQIVLTPRKNYGTGKQFSHLIKDLQITDDNYTFMIDVGKITKNEITIVIYPNTFKNMEDMTKRTISQIIGILNLNSTKIVSVNYVLSEALANKLMDNEKNNTYTNSCKCHECEQSCCDNSLCENHVTKTCDDKCNDCNDECSCFKNPDLECCKSCDLSEECGCYIQKTNRHEFSYNTENATNSGSKPEKTIRIPVNPVNPKDELIMLANAMAKRLELLNIDKDIIRATIDVDRSKFKTEILFDIKTSTKFIL